MSLTIRFSFVSVSAMRVVQKLIVRTLSFIWSVASLSRRTSSRIALFPFDISFEARNEKALSEIEDVLRQKGYLIESKDSEAVYEAKDYAQV